MGVKFNLRPLTGEIIVRRDEGTTKVGSIHLAKKKGSREGTVLAAGDSKELKDGDRVIFTEYAGRTMKWEGENIYIVTEKLILAKLYS